MGRGINKVFLLGAVGKDPEIRATAGGSSVASFSLATSDRQKNQSGEWEDKTEWHNIVALGRTAEIVRDYVTKGTQLHIEGKIQNRSWDDKSTGEKKYKSEVLCNELTLLGSKGDSGGSAPAPQSTGRGSAPTTRSASPQQARTTTAPQTRAASPVDDFFSDGTGITDSDIPF